MSGIVKTTPEVTNLKAANEKIIGATNPDLVEKTKRGTTAKMYLRGVVSNSLALMALFSIGHFLRVERFVAVALGMQLAVYIVHGLPQRSEKFYDLSGSFTHLAVVVTALMSRQLHGPRQIFCAVGSVIWMTRLGTFLYNRILKDGKDDRFSHIKPNWLAFLGAWTIQAAWVTMIQLPVILLHTVDDQAPLGVVDVVGMLIWVIAFLTEAAADSEKMAFRSVAENRHKFITTGLWSYSRHPNYFGEILMWTAMALISSNAAFVLGAPMLFAAWISPAFTMFLLLKVSGVPMVERAGEKKWGKDPVYQRYMANTSCVVPWFPTHLDSDGRRKGL